VGEAAHVAGALEAVNQVGDAGSVNLQAITDLAERQRTAARQMQQHQRLIAGEREVEIGDDRVQAADQDLLGTHDRGDRAHRRRRLVAPALPP
jgi:hypothetical protein